MSYNTAAVANELVTVLSGLSGMGGAQIGAPEAVGPRVSSYVTMGGQRTIKKATGVTQRETRFFCVLVYRVEETETAAEATLMTLVDAFFNALDADLTLNGTVFSLQADSQAADEPEYQMRSGKEYREYPIVVTVIQRDSYTVNP
ncbi:MAG: hypothetical protein ACRC2U_07095 [Aeromonas sp.]